MNNHMENEMKMELNFTNEEKESFQCKKNESTIETCYDNECDSNNNTVNIQELSLVKLKNMAKQEEISDSIIKTYGKRTKKQTYIDAITAKLLGTLSTSGD